MRSFQFCMGYFQNAERVDVAQAILKLAILLSPQCEDYILPNSLTSTAKKAQGFSLQSSNGKDAGGEGTFLPSSLCMSHRQEDSVHRADAGPSSGLELDLLP